MSEKGDGDFRRDQPSELELSDQGHGSGGEHALDNNTSDTLVARLTTLISGIVEQTQSCMENLLSTVSEIDSCVTEIVDDMHRARESTVERKCKLDEDKADIHLAACRVLEALGGTTDT